LVAANTVAGQVGAIASALTSAGRPAPLGADSREIFHLKPSGGGAQLFATSVDGTSGSLQIGKVQGLFSFSLPSRVLVMLQNTAGTPYDVASDGQRFLIITRPEPRTTAAPMTVILNWTALRKG
jgi:hypothetical protein